MATQTQMEKRTSPTISPQSITLANQARMEQMQNGRVSVICPKCHTHPTIAMTSRGERTIILCECGYIKNVEINF
jgi:RNase P subunit RPR2